MAPSPNSSNICDDVLIAIRRITQRIDQHSKRLVKQFGLTGPQLLILKEIDQSEEITASDISRAISLSQATATGHRAGGHLAAFGYLLQNDQLRAGQAGFLDQVARVHVHGLDDAADGNQDMVADGFEQFVMGAVHGDPLRLN